MANNTTLQLAFAIGKLCADLGMSSNEACDWCNEHGCTSDNDEEAEAIIDEIVRGLHS